MSAYANPNIKVPARIHQFLESADSLLSDLKSLGEFSPEIHTKIRSETLPQRVSDTLNIEGIPVNPRITKAIMEGRILSETDKYHAREVENTIDAIDFAVDHVTNNHPIDLAFTREIHRRMDNLCESASGAVTLRIRRHLGLFTHVH